MIRLCILLLSAAKALAAVLGCDSPQQVGVEFGVNGPIPDARMTANSEINKWHSPAQGRLNNYQHKPDTSRGVGAWCADKNDNMANRYLQVDLGTTRSIGRIATQGRNTTSAQWVKTYQVSYSTGGVIFTGIHDGNLLKVFTANTDSNSIVYNDLASSNGEPLMARYIRVLPVEFRGNICMRVELYECVAPTPTQPPATQTPCPVGFTLAADNVTCTDVDECDLATDLCTQNCHNTNGSYTCSCNAGYRLESDGVRCTDIDECTENIDGCSQVCIDNEGSYSCTCRDGYQLQSDGKTCLDKDECGLGIDQCSQNCNNTDGSYRCSCNVGYRLQGDGKTCANIDECKENTSGCTQVCTDNVGSFACTCHSGYQLQSDGKTCLDINECLSNNGGCSDTCVNLNGDYYCSCPSGYEIDSSTKKVCQDKNECLQANGGCNHVCTNTNGSYECSCNSGFQLNPDGLTCKDIDECTDGSSQCEPDSTVCHNFIPGYECLCKPGYETIQNNNYECQARTCDALVVTTGTNVSPSSCLNNQNSIGDVCTFSCQAGYEFNSVTKVLVCEPSGNWNGSVVYCQRVSCPKLTAPDNGAIYPATCTTVGNLYEKTCSYTCNNGYKISGVNVKTCQSNAQWDSQEEPTCSPVFQAPWISCPNNVIVVLSTGANTADVSALLGSPTSNYPDRITLTPEQYNTNKIFPAGETVLTYTATNPNNEVASCMVRVIVQDTEPPKVSDCPTNIYKLAPSTSNSVVVSWTEPTFTDNVGVVNVSQSHVPGDTFGIGQSTVHYTARDASVSSGTTVCEFNVIVKRQQCLDPPDPDNGKINCFFLGSTKYCTIACDPNKATFTWVFNVGTSCDNNDVPDCVDHMSAAADGSCSTGYVIQSGNPAGPTTCVKCPRGMYYNISSSNCEKCLIGTISTAEGSLQCQACPPLQSTAEEGSKICIAQCSAGKFSTTGLDLPGELSPCEHCSKNTYQDKVGQKTCDKCPDGTSTITIGSTSADDCGGPPMITQFGPNPTNATEKQRTQFECHGNGRPSPTFYIKKVLPAPDGFGGPVTRENIFDQNGNRIGLRYIILDVTDHDGGAYECRLVNQHGNVTQYITVTVKRVFIGKRRRRRRHLRQIFRI
ncbi:signal peptide, CUB and EGF-like domain-containing protein 1 isoform X2 [Montipora foliosa]|uniref:signal peptide, CUB and EGF-like domain-containing protein 1 isoform X2 n=1 Tax=Montipora foliosa TaxID=591990 RepID=UPI0035F20DA1